MSCKLDVRKAILDKVIQEITGGRYSFTRISDDTVQINSRGVDRRAKANSSQQAYAMAKEVISRTEKSFNGMVSGYVMQPSVYDPTLVVFTIKPQYVDYVYENLPTEQKTDSEYTQVQLSPKEERDLILSNTGFKNHNRIFPLFSPAAESGVFEKFIQFKRSQIYEYRQRLGKIEVAKKKKDITTEELIKLNKQERELKLKVEGNFELGIKGLEQEIYELKDKAEVEAVKYYAEKDLERLDSLANSSNIDDLHESQRIIDFYKLSGTFQRNIENPFFTQEDIFLPDEYGNLTTNYKLSEEVMNTFIGWRNRVSSIQNIIDKRKEEVTVNTVNSDIAVKRTYDNKEFTFDDLINSESGLKDTDWISMWTMDVTQGMFSNNGILPQVMFSHLTNQFEKKKAWARGIEEKIDKMNPGVQKELVKLGYSLRGAGILGINGASYQIFKEVTKEGNETGGLIQRYVKEFYDEQATVMNKFRETFDKARESEDSTKKSSLFNKAFEELKKWRRDNTIILDITKVPEIIGDSEFSEFKGDVDKTETESYKKELIDIIGEKAYKEHITEQRKHLRKYLSERQSMIDTLLVMENKSDINELSDKAKSNLSYWENNHHPHKGVEDYYSVNGIFFGDRKANNFMDYNIFIPRRYKASVSINTNENKYSFKNTNTLTGYYNNIFKTIEDNPVLNDFYDVIKEVCDTIRENIPYELQQKIAANTVPALAKSSAEILADKNTGALSSLFSAFRDLIERIRLSFGVVKQSELSYAVTDPITGRTNYKVNDSFLSGNSRAVQERMTIEKVKFLQAYNDGKNYMDTLSKIRRFTTLNYKMMNTSSLVLLAEYANVDISLADIKAGRLDKLLAVTGENIEIGKYIRDFSLHSVVQSQSFDLARIGKYYSNVVMAYAARQEALPVLEVMKQHYESIKKPMTNNLNKGIYNVHDDQFMTQGIRNNAIKQMDDWFERVVLDNYGTKHFGPHGNNTKIKELVDKAGKKISMPSYFRDIYSKEEKKKLTEIENLLKNEKDPDKIAELNKIKQSLGKVRTATAFFDNFLAWIRTMRLGYNLSSATTNFLEGTTSNMILAASGEYFDPKEIYYGYNVVKHSFLKNITFGIAETGLAKRNRKLMDKFNVIMDSKNELQKSSTKTYASKLSWLNPHEVNSRVEYVNQSPVMIAMLRTIKIKDINGKESSLWEAFNNDGHLKDEFKTESNIKNWEQLTGEEYLAFKQKLHKGVVLAHGNYDELRGMMIKSSTAGKALAMFKTWLPMQLYWRFATEQDDIQSGTVGFKGRYWSYGKGTGLVYGAAIGTALFGPVGALVTGIAGAAMGKFFGVDSGVGMLQETIYSTKQLFKKTLGMPVNLIAGRNIISSDNKAFENWIGKGNFTAQDAKNMRSNMADISLQLMWLALILIVKGMLWDDEDEPESGKRMAHNILINKLMQLSGAAAQYVNPVDTYNSVVGSNAVMQYLEETGKEIGKLSEAVHGRDIAASGQNAGESNLWTQTTKTFLPGLFKDNMLGFKTQSERVFEESPFHSYFKSDAKVDEEDNKRERASRKNELKEQGLDDKEIRKTLDYELPTPTKLKKLELSREEYEEQFLEDNEE